MNTPHHNPVDEAIASRRSIRAFLPTPVEQATIRAILATASRAPSGTNTQPWRVYVLTGKALTGISKNILSVYNNPDEAAQHTSEYAYYPNKWISPYLERLGPVWPAGHHQGRQDGHAPSAWAQLCFF